MINVIQTLKNLNKEFPRYQLETLLKIVECIQDDPIIKYPDWLNDNTTWKTCPVQCTASFTPNGAFVYNTTTKNHAADKTSYNQTITSEGEEARDEDLITEEDLRGLSDVIEAISAAYNQKH